MSQDRSSAEVVMEDEAPAVVAEDLLVEEVSIDGMCGVY
jgi:mycofactocin precursor